jgi:gas vesicle protein
MFPFGKKKRQIEENPENQPEKKKNKMDKLIMGAIIGVAVGSVVGMTMAPQKGKETRRMIAEKGKEAYVKGREISDAIFKPKKKEKFGKRLLHALFGRKHKQMAPLKEIPGEAVTENEEWEKM